MTNTLMLNDVLLAKMSPKSVACSLKSAGCNMITTLEHLPAALDFNVGNVDIVNYYRSWKLNSCKGVSLSAFNYRINTSRRNGAARLLSQELNVLKQGLQQDASHFSREVTEYNWSLRYVGLIHAVVDPVIRSSNLTPSKNFISNISHQIKSNSN